MNFDIKSGIGALPLMFGMSERQVSALVGEPQFKGKNFFGEVEWSYELFTVHFDAEGVAEIGFVHEAVVLLDGVDLFGTEGAFASLVMSTPSVFECVDTVVLPDLGLSFMGFCEEDGTERTMTVFKLGRWDRFRADFRPFRLPPGCV